MENLINDICQKTGIDRATAEKVAGYLKDNMTRIPELLQTAQAGGLKGVVSSVASKVGEVMGRRA
jgi:hypothetical protein